MLDRLFLELLNMSFTGGVVIVFVLLARLLLKKAPKVFSYGLWAVVLFRLVCPISLESVLSLLPTKAAPISQDIVYMQAPRIDTGIEALNNAVSSVLPAGNPLGSVNPLQIWVFLGSCVWVLGMAVLLGYSLIALARLRKRLAGAVPCQEGVFVSEQIETAFVMGVFRPQIYLPANLSDREKSYILLHEQTHIRRLDHLVKLVSFLALCVHWFNPLVWAAFFLSGQDMELSCDEAVIRQVGSDMKKDYSTSLLTLATGRRIVGGTPLAFGEGDTKGRIKNVLDYKKPALWVGMIAALAVLALVVGLSTNQAQVRTFPMAGSKLSDLQPQGVSGQVAEILGVTAGDLMISPDNFGLTVSSDFQLDRGETVRTVYTLDKTPQSAQLRIFPETSEFFVTAPTDWVETDAPHFSLQAYLEALKHLPTGEIAALSETPPQRYAIELAPADRKYNEGRQIFYDEDGVTEPGGWAIRLDLHPLYGDEGGSFHGTGSDMIHVYYTPAEKGVYYIFRFGAGGVVPAGYSSTDAELAQAVIMDALAKSAAWEGKDIATLEEGFLIQQSFPATGESTDYYAYLLEDGTPVLQGGPGGRYTTLSPQLYDRLEAVFAPTPAIPFWIKPDEPPQVIGETAAAAWLQSFQSPSIPVEERIASYTVTEVTVMAGEPKEGEAWEDMAYHYVVHMTYDITTASQHYLSPGDGVSGLGTFEGLFRELSVQMKFDDGGGFLIVGVGTGGAAQAFP